MTKRLESARVAPGSFISTGPAAFAAIEAAVAEIFGVPIDSLLTNAVMEITDVAGAGNARVSASPRIEASGSTKGLRIVSADGTEEYILSITNSGTPRYLEIYRRTTASTEAAPVYELANRMALSGDDVGRWENQVVAFLDLTDTPASFPTSRSQLAVNAAHDALEFFDPVAYSAFSNGGSTIISNGPTFGVLYQLVAGTLGTGFSLGGTFNEQIVIPPGTWRIEGVVVVDMSHPEGVYVVQGEAVSGVATVNIGGGGIGLPDGGGGTFVFSGIVETDAGCALRFLFYRSGTSSATVVAANISIFRIGLK